MNTVQGVPVINEDDHTVTVDTLIIAHDLVLPPPNRKTDWWDKLLEMAHKNLQVRVTYDMRPELVITKLEMV